MTIPGEPLPIHGTSSRRMTIDSDETRVPSEDGSRTILSNGSDVTMSPSDASEQHDTVRSPKGKKKMHDGQIEDSLSRTGRTPAGPYSLLTDTQQRTIAGLVIFTAFSCALTPTMYLSHLSPLRGDVDVTIEPIIATVAAYLAMQGVSAAIFGQLADKIGRRPVYLISLSIFLGTSIGLALRDDTYAALLVLRIFQSFGASASATLAIGIVSDMISAHEQSGTMTTLLTVLNVAPALGPVIGGPLCGSVGISWVFWLSTILAGVLLMVLALVLPETNRSLVGSESIASSALNQPLFPWLRPRIPANVPQQQLVYVSMWQRCRSDILNPFRATALLSEGDTACFVLVRATSLAVYYVSLLSLALALRVVYKFGEVKTGVCFLAVCGGVAVGSVFQGRFMKWSAAWASNHSPTHDGSGVSIEEASTRFASIFLLLQSGSALGFGWAVDSRLHIAVPLVFLFFQGFVSWDQTWNTLILGAHRDSPSTAYAASELVSGVLAAGGVAATWPLIQLLGVGTFFTIATGLASLIGVVLTAIVRRKGAQCREKRERRAEQDGQGRQEKNESEFSGRSLKSPVTMPRSAAPLLHMSTHRHPTGQHR